MKKNGFTLIELIIVVIIIGILAAIAAPIMSGMQTRAMCSEAVAALGTMRTALRAYYAEYNGFPDTGCWVPVTDPANSALMSYIGIPIENLNGKYFDKNCYYLYLDPGFSSTTHDSWVMMSPYTDSQAKMITDSRTADSSYILMRLINGKIQQSGITKSGYPQDDGNL